MAKNYMFKNCYERSIQSTRKSTFKIKYSGRQLNCGKQTFGYTKEDRDLFVKLSAFVGQCHPVAFVVCAAEYSIQLLKGHSRLLLRHLHGSYSHHTGPGAVRETQLYISLDNGLTNAAWIMDKSLAWILSWGESPANCKLQTLNDCRSTQRRKRKHRSDNVSLQGDCTKHAPVTIYFSALTCHIHWHQQ